MGDAEQMKELAFAAKDNAVRKAQQEAETRRTREQAIDAEVKAGIQAEYQKEWRPQIKEAAMKGENSVVLMLGACEGLGGDEHTIRQQAKTKYLMALLGEEGYKVEVSYPTRRYADDHSGDREIDIRVTW